MKKFLFYFLILFFLYSCDNQTHNTNPNIKVDTTEKQNNVRKKPNTGRKHNGTGIYEFYENADRVVWQKPEVVIEQLGDLSEKTVADIGAGKGYFSFRLASKAKKVIAIDINKDLVKYLDSLKLYELPEDVQPRLEARLASPDNPMLKDEELDAAVIVNTYMYMSNKVDYLKILKKGIKPGGKVLIVDFKKKKTPIGPPSKIRVPLFQVELDFEKAGYKNIVSFDNILDYQYLVLAEK